MNYLFFLNLNLYILFSLFDLNLFIILSRKLFSFSFSSFWLLVFSCTKIFSTTSGFFGNLNILLNEFLNVFFLILFVALSNKSADNLFLKSFFCSSSVVLCHLSKYFFNIILFWFGSDFNIFVNLLLIDFLCKKSNNLDFEFFNANLFLKTF